MRFLQKDKIIKSVIVISDIHLGAGQYVNGDRNYLEDFHFDEELVDFLDFYSSGDYLNREVELVINGDLLDHLAVPYVEYYDDEYWSEKAAIKKTEMILDAHKEVINAFDEFASKKKKKITYIIGNHDAEMVFESCQKVLKDRLSEKGRESFQILLNPDADYSPYKGIIIRHGHEYELAHQFDPNDSIIEAKSGDRYFNPPWGSYYVTRIINKFKEERDHINAVRPIKKFLINGLIYDPLFTIRFMLANAFYFFMVRSIFIIKQSKNLSKIFDLVKKELELFQDYELLTEKYLQENEDVRVLLVGHTHEPVIRTFSTGQTFINTGTWTRMYHLDFGKGQDLLTYASVDISDENEERPQLEVALNNWKGTNKLPYSELS